MEKIKIYCVGRLIKLFEPTVDISTDSFNTRNEKEAIEKYKEWKIDAIKTIPFEKTEETEFPIKNGNASYEISDCFNSILVWLAVEEI